MRGIISAAGYLPYHRLRRDAVPPSVGGGRGRGTRAVASWDEDATTLGVAAARLALEGDVPAPHAMTFATSTPPYLDKTNATAVHAALRLDRSVRAVDAGGAPRSSVGALLAALEGGSSSLVVSGDVRTGRPGSPDEVETGDAGAAVLVGSGEDAPLVAEFLGSASATEEFLDRYRPPGEAHTIRWEERFGETRYVPAAQEAHAAACKAAGITPADVDHLVVTGLHARAVGRARKAIGGDASTIVDDLTSDIGNSGTPHPLLLLTDVLERARPGQTIAVVVLADGADAFVLRTTDVVRRARRTVAEQVATGTDRLDYLRFLTWRGNLAPEPPRRPSPARASAPAAARNADWKFGFVGSRDQSTGALHLPPARVSWDGGAVDEMTPAPMADVLATIRTFTVDHLAWSPSPPTVFAVLDFDGGGRYACPMTDVDADAVAIGDRVELTFRRLGEADGVVNYFWKARPLRVADPASEA